jgi:hypothetical protein
MHPYRPKTVPNISCNTPFYVCYLVLKKNHSGDKLHKLKAINFNFSTNVHEISSDQFLVAAWSKMKTGNRNSIKMARFRTTAFYTLIVQFRTGYVIQLGTNWISLLIFYFIYLNYQNNEQSLPKIYYRITGVEMYQYQKLVGTSHFCIDTCGILYLHGLFSFSF